MPAERRPQSDDTAPIEGSATGRGQWKDRDRTVASGAGATVSAASAAPAAEDSPHLADRALETRLGGTGSRGGEGSNERFEFTGLLGVGATGQVFAVYDRDLQRPIAVKMLKDQTQGAGLLEFLEEARVTASLQHPNVLPIHDVDLAVDGRPCFSMSRIDGVTLGDVIERSTDAQRDALIATPNAIATIFIAICHAVAYAHSRSVIHQDLKPDNVLLGSYGEVLVLDWGCAVRVGESGECTSRIYGTPLYMSPEQARRERSDRLSDVYCLGATLFHALTLRIPTWSSDEEEFWRRKCAGVIESPSTVEQRSMPPELLSIALKALVPDPAQRYAGASDMARDLARFQAGLAVSAHREPLWRVLLRWYRANRRLTWVVAIACLAISLLGAAVAAEKAKERSRWLLTSDGFSGELAERWKGKIKSWDAMQAQAAPIDDAKHFTREPGAMVIASDALSYTDLVYRRPLLGDLRIEWTYTSLGDGTNLNCFIEGDDRESGYTFHVGGFDIPGSYTLTKGATAEILQRRIGTVLAPRHPYRFLMEKEGPRLRLEIDGDTVIDYRDLDAGNIPDSGTFGFDACNRYSNRIGDVRIWHRPLAQRITPIDFARKLLDMQRYPQAYAQFADILDAYGSGSAFAPDAVYGMALCCARQGDAEGARALLDRFEREHPGHELAPYCLRERISLASAAGDEAEVERGMAGISVFPGHPALRSVATRLVGDELSRACPRRAPAVGEDAYPGDAPERIVRSAAKVRRWLGQLGVPMSETTFSRQASEALGWFGRDDLIITLFPEDRSACAHALLRTGRFEDVLSGYPELSGPRGTALKSMGRTDEVIAGPYDPTDRIPACLASGQVERALTLFPHDYDLLRALGRDQEVLAEAPATDKNRCFILLDQRRPEEVLSMPGAARWAQAAALMQLGRYDEILRDYRDIENIGYRCAESMIMEAPPATRGRGRALLAQLGRAQAGLHATTFARFFLPMLVANLDGEAVDPRTDLSWLLDRGRFLTRQCPWYTAALITGRIDDQEFLRQPQRLQVDLRLHFAHALQAELAHDWPRERVELAALAAERFLFSLEPSELKYIRWRQQESAQR